jgi:hypothetical protein
MKKLLLLVGFLCATASLLQAQMVVGTDTLYGNEWINYSQKYYKIRSRTTGIVRISYAELQTAIGTGSLPAIKGKQFRMYFMGKEVPIFVSDTGSITPNTYVEFYSRPHPSYIDQFMVSDTAKYWFSPQCSWSGADSPYFLTWQTTGTARRYTTVDNGMSGANLPPKEAYYTGVAGNRNYIDKPNTTPAFFRWSPGIEYAGEAQLGGYEARGVQSDSTKVTYARDTFATSSIYAAGPPATVNVRVRLYEGKSHNVHFYVNGTDYLQDNLQGYKLSNYTFTVPTSALTAKSALKVQGLNDRDWVGMASAMLYYPRQFDFENKETYDFDITASATPKYIEITNFKHSNVAPILYDHTLGIRIVTKLDNGIVKFVLPVATQTHRLTLRAAVTTGYVLATVTNNTEIGNNVKLFPITFKDFSKTTNQGNYIIISNKRLYDDGNGSNWVQEYASFRNSTGYVTTIADVEDLYNQYAYGVDGHPLAVRNFSWLAKRRFAQSPKYVFLIGKGFWAVYSVLGRDNYAPFVPGYGYPASDNAMMGTNKSNIPCIPFGRLAVTKGSQVKDYLTKIQQQEAALNAPNSEESKAWMKKVIHMAGAEDNPNIISYLNNYKATIEAPAYGGQVFTFQKRSSEPAPLVTSLYLDSLITTGVSVMNMFGHAYANGTDYNLIPEDLHNQGKYPLVLSLGCYSGDMFDLATQNLSERFTLAPQKAGVGFVASVHLNLPDQLDRFASKFYRHLSNDMYGKGIGDIMKQTIADDDIGNIIINQNLLYQGDPALRLSVAAAPDYVIKTNSVNFTPNIIATTDNNFKLSYTIMNLGKAVAHDLNVTIERQFANNRLPEVTTQRLKAPYFVRDTFVNLAVGGSDIYGANKIKICVDAANEINELPAPTAENNNCTVIDFQVYSNQVIPVYPINFGIHNNSTVTLKAANTNPLGLPTNYVIEIDTTELFNGATTRQTITNFVGGLLEWTPNIVLRDSTVYYWRVKVLNGAITTLWQNSSFIYLKNEVPGWNQSHYYQYKKDQFTTLTLPRTGSKFQFIDNNLELTLDYGTLFSNGSETYSDYCFGNKGGVMLTAINNATGEALVNSPVNGNIWKYGSLNCDARQANGFFFETTNQAGRDSLKRFLTQVVPPNYYVLLWTYGDYRSDLWAADAAPNLMDILAQQGATKITQSTNIRRAYVFFYKKNVGALRELFDINRTNEWTQENFEVQGRWDNGKLLSTVIGPAAQWGSMHWRLSNRDASAVTGIDIYGIKADRTEYLLQQNVQNPNYLLNTISATTYPYLRMAWNMRDPSRTCPNLDYWRVLYKQVPELVLRREKFFTFERDTVVDRGETVRMKVAVENITATDMDSLNVRYTITNENNTAIQKDVKIGKLLGNSQLITDFSYSTNDLNSDKKYRLRIDANPESPQNGTRQTELFYFNNAGEYNFRVKQDVKNPLLDVTFDGVHILDNDVVSSRPTIVMTLKDENKWLALNDTSRFKVFLQTPNNVLRTQIFLSDPNLHFYGADQTALNKSNNRARIEYTPTFAVDGVYTLFVQGNDVVGNDAGNQNYKVNFKIYNKSGMSNVLNYPNPFSTSTQFVFTLTGNEVPDYFKIQIMTVTGQVVREITKAELGLLHIGLNRTEFAWDGTDQYGDRLANGVYLYRVTARKANGQPYEMVTDRENGSSLSTYFQGGFGKMYLMR